MRKRSFRHSADRLLRAFRDHGPSPTLPRDESHRCLRCCAPSPALAGEGWGGGEPHTPLPETSTSAEASAHEADDKLAVPEWRPHPNPPPQEREPEDNARGWKQSASRKVSRNQYPNSPASA